MITRDTDKGGLCWSSSKLLCAVTCSPDLKCSCSSAINGASRPGQNQFVVEIENHFGISSAVWPGAE